MKIPRRAGRVAGVLDAGQQHRQRRLAGQRRDRIMENIGREPSTVHGTIHGPGYSGAEGIGAGRSIGGAFADAFHVFAMDWAPDRNLVGRRPRLPDPHPAGLGGDRWVFDHPLFIIPNLAVGGFWPGDPDGGTVFPRQLVIDYVRVTTDPGGTGSRITGLGGTCVDVAGGSTADVGGGPALDRNGTGAQRWTVTGARDTVNPQADKCLDATGNSSASGTRLQI
jgi:hypothetical protein